MNRKRLARFIGLASIAATMPSFAADRYWIGGTGTWQTGTWTATNGGTLATTVPGSNDNAFIFSNAPITVFRDATTGTGNTATLQLDGSAGALVTLDKSSTSNYTVISIFNGLSGNAAINASGGTLTIANLFLGAQAGGFGSITTNNTLWNVGALSIGSAGFGNVDQNGGTVNYTSFAQLGAAAGSSGVYTLSGGTLTGGGVLPFIVGNAGSGSLNINGGSASLGALTIGSTSTGQGHVVISAGSLSVPSETRIGAIGGSLASDLTVSGGNATFNSLTVNSNSTFRVTGGSIGINSVVSINGGTISLGTGSFIVNSTRTLTINDGTFIASNITSSGGASLVFNSGAISFTNADFNPLLNTVLGPGSINLPVTKSLAISGTTTLAAAVPLVLSGGTFSTGSLAGNLAAFQFGSGAFRLSASSLTFGAGGIFGATYTIDASRKLFVANLMGAKIDADAQLNIDGGLLDVSGTLLNLGIIDLASSTSKIAAGTLQNQGLIEGSGRIAGSLANQSGEVRVAAGQQIRAEGATHSNAGILNLLGGNLDFTGALTNTGRIEGRGQLSTSSLSNSATLALSAGISDIHGDITNTATGRVIVSGNANVSFWDDFTNSAGGSVKVSPGSVASFFGTYGGAGITGGGSVNFESDITPGFSPAAISIAGNVNFGSSSKLHIELAGTTRGTQYDAVDISGGAALDGELRVSSLNGFVPLPGMTFNVLTYGSRSNQFQIVNDTSLKGLIFTPIYSASALNLQANGTGGDANLDGRVDISDLYILATHYQLAGQNWLTADFTGDGAVNGLDLAALSAHWQFGTTAGPALPLDFLLSSLGLPNVAVPEPSSIGFIGIAVAGLLRRRRRIRHIC